MLHYEFRPHRNFLRAGMAEPQKVFTMLKLVPQASVAQVRAPLALALVIDTSGSMSGEPLQTAMAAAHQLLDDSRLTGDDQVMIVQFDSTASTLLPLTRMTKKQAAKQAIDSLPNYAGGTEMAKGLQQAKAGIQALPASVAKRIFLLSDGETFDEPECLALRASFREANAPLVPIGIDDYNEQLFIQLADGTGGRPYHLQRMDQLADILDVEIGSSVREVVTDLTAGVSCVRGVALERVTKVYPNLLAIGDGPPYRLGNIMAGEETIYILEFTVSGLKRPPSRVRIAQVALSGAMAGMRQHSELPVQDLFVSFTEDEAQTAGVDEEVMGYVSQINIDKMINQAMDESRSDPAQAQKTLMMARNMTVRLGNAGTTVMLDGALSALQQDGAIPSDIQKTIRVGSKTQTVRAGGATDLAQGGGLSEEEIRRATGI